MGLLANCMYFIFRQFYKKPEIEIPPTLDLSDPVVFIVNHNHIYSPIVTTLYFPIPYRPWVTYEMITPGVTAGYIRDTFFMETHQQKRWVSVIMGGILGPMAINVVNASRPIPVYRNQRRITETFKKSVQALREGSNLLIFPEKADQPSEEHAHVKMFRTGFIYLAQMYYRVVRKRLHFVPVSINPDAMRVRVGDAVVFDPEEDFQAEKQRITQALMNAIDELYT
ncbi:MAG: 1-acyl-sn-glycerol-3-phosphate acyltransferase [Anaerolineaceae bacterium]|nr:1-acyl-sn-glycerol-3-phosphate acyltransferase [Anaerolineaceae bacterium]